MPQTPYSMMGRVEQKNGQLNILYIYAHEVSLLTQQTKFDLYMKRLKNALKNKCAYKMSQNISNLQGFLSSL